MPFIFTDFGLAKVYNTKYILYTLDVKQKSINHSYNLANILYASVQVKNKNDKDHTTCKKRVSVERIIYVNKKSLMIPEG
jgi:hypothetical protein